MGQFIGKGLHLLRGEGFFFPQRLHHLVRPLSPELLGLHLQKKIKCESVSCIQLFAAPWTIVCQAPRSMEFSKQEYWSG